MPTVSDAPAGGRSERVLLIGNYGNGNVGDDAILLQMAPTALAHGRVVVLSRHPERIASLVPDVSCRAMVSRHALAAFVRADTVVIGGGGMFGRGLPPLVALLPFVLLASTYLGKDVELRAVGAYPDMPPPVAWGLRRLVRRSRHASARDPASVTALGGPDLVTLVRDPAWALEPAPSGVVTTLLADAGVDTSLPLVAVALKPGAGEATDDHLLAAVADGLDRWASDGAGQIIFLSLSDKGDYNLGAALTDLDLGNRLQEGMTHGDRVRFVGPGLHPAVMRGVIGRCTAVVALRLHAQIFAKSAGRPLFGLSFEAKCDEFLAAEGRPRSDPTRSPATTWRTGWRRSPPVPRSRSGGVPRGRPSARPPSVTRSVARWTGTQDRDPEGPPCPRRHQASPDCARGRLRRRAGRRAGGDRRARTGRLVRTTPRRCPHATTSPVLGLLQATAPNFTRERAAGIESVTIGAVWSLAQSSSATVFSSAYAGQLHSVIGQARAAGLSVVLDPGSSTRHHGPSP